MLHATGRAGLSWSSDDYYGELEFFANATVAYFFVIGANKHKGLVTFTESAIPASITALLPS